MKNKIENHHLFFARSNFNKGLARDVRNHKNAIIRIEHNNHKDLHHLMHQHFGDNLINQKFSHNSLLGINEYNQAFNNKNVLTYLGDLALLVFDDDYARDFLIKQKNILGGM